MVFFFPAAGASRDAQASPRSVPNAVQPAQQCRPASYHGDMKNSWLAELKRKNPSEIRLGLDRMVRLLKRLGDPHRDYPAVIVAGTNGKGSVTAMIASMLSAGRYRAGWYTSPHLVDVRERIRIGEQVISMKSMQACMEIVQSCQEEELTYFEFLTAVAFLHFSRARVDMAVLEVGLGGRLDATNVVDPLVSIITNIALDHQAFLGNSLDRIAAEKGGIIKQGGICITGAKQVPVLAVLEKICRDRNARLLRLGRDLKIRVSPDGLFSYRGFSGSRQSGLRCPLRGRHQYANAALALGVVERLGECGYPVEDSLIRSGLERTRWEGRGEVLQRHPTVLLDGAHNPDGISALCGVLQRDFSFQRLFVVFGVLSDKDRFAMIGKISSIADVMILTRPGSERAVEPAALLPLVKKDSENIIVEPNPVRAVRSALDAAEENDLICIAGSLYLVGDIKKAFRAGRLP